MTLTAPKREVTIRIIMLCIACSTVLGLWFWSRPDAATLLTTGLEMEVRDPAAARPLFVQAITRKNGDFPDAQIALCNIEAQFGNWSEATSSFHSLEKTSIRSDLLVRFGHLAYQGKQYEASIAALEIVRNRDDDETLAALKILSPAYREVGRQKDFEFATREVIRRAPQDFSMWWSLIQYLKSTFRNADCVITLREALSHNPPREFEVELQFQLVEQLLATGNKKEAWKEYTILEENSDRSPRLLTLKVDLHRLSGQLTEALQVITEIFPYTNHLPDAYLARGVIHFDLHNFEKAAQDFERLVQMQPHNERAHHKLADTYRLLDRLEASVHHRKLGNDIREKRRNVNSLIEQYSKSPQRETQSRIIEIYSELGEVEAAQYWKQKSANF